MIPANAKIIIYPAALIGGYALASYLRKRSSAADQRAGLPRASDLPRSVYFDIAGRMGAVMMAFIAPLVLFQFAFFAADPDQKRFPLWIYPATTIITISIASVVLNRMRNRLLREAGERSRDQLALGPVPDPNPKPAIMKVVGLVFGFVVLGIFSAAIFPSVSGKWANNRETAKFLKLDWTHGPKVVEIGSDAKMKVPKGFMYVSDAQAGRFLQLLGSKPNAGDVGILSPENFDWYAVFTFTETGYIDDTHKAALDPDSLLNAIRRATEDYRQRNHVRTLEPVKWSLAPHYDAGAHELEWSVDEQNASGDHFSMYRAIYLGRRGIVRVVLRYHDYDRALASFTKLSKGISFLPGRSHDDVRGSDPRSGTPLADLVTKADPTVIN